MKKYSVALFSFLFAAGIGQQALADDIVKRSAGSNSGPVSSAGSRARVLAAEYEGVINPACAEYLAGAIAKAEEGKYDAVVIRLDTPGGLDLAMRDIIKAELGSTVPVVVYVSPQGGRAASAGVFITIAADVAVMAPGTNIGAAHPVALGAVSAPGEKKENAPAKDPMEAKVLNDASAYISAISQKRSRNVEWAVKAVRESNSIPAAEAVKLKVVDFIADDMNDLLAKLHGREVKGFGTLNTAGAVVDEFRLTRRQKILAAISDPNIAMILMSLGAAGLLIELYSPGLILPGVAGGIALLLAFYSLKTLSANFAGVALLFLGLLCFIAEIKVASYGLLTTGGIISLVLGMIMLFNGASSFGLNVSYSVIFGTVAGLLAVTGIMLYVVRAAFGRRVVTGREALAGAEGIAKTALNPDGTVLVQGELWDSVSPYGSIEKGEKVVVESAKGFTLTVRKA
ncbi:MAG: nodulation protein NfeD [Elusimicrobiaceae bacterium]|nr:nodulation protein NfeD [Elusimicrobiaceae bacterium]